MKFKVYPNGFQGKQLNSSDVLDLSSIAACMWLKTEIVSRNFLKESDYNVMLNKAPEYWCLSVKVASENRTLCQIRLDESGSFEVNLIFNFNLFC